LLLAAAVRSLTHLTATTTAKSPKTAQVVSALVVQTTTVWAESMAMVQRISRVARVLVTAEASSVTAK
jgi:hypothetical protein